MGALREIIDQEERMAEEAEDNFKFDESYREPISVQISDDWDTMMEEYMDEFQDYGDFDALG